MDSITYFVNKLFGSLSQTFPNCTLNIAPKSEIDIFAPNSNDEDDEQLINESEKQGKRISAIFREEYGDHCSHFVDMSLPDAVWILHGYYCFIISRLRFQLLSRNLL